MAKAALAVSRLGAFLQRTYVPHLDLSDAQAKQREERDDCALTRSLAAHCLSRLCRLDPIDAADHVTDGFADLGIDGFVYDRTAKMVYIVQAKWSGNGNKRVTEADASKTLAGLRSLLSVDFSDANARLSRFAPDCEEAANDSETRFTVVFATTASESLVTGAKRMVAKEIERIGGLTGLVLHEDFALPRLYETLNSASAPKESA